MSIEKALNKILENIDVVTTQSSPLGVQLWEELTKTHPADIAQFLSNIDKNNAKKLFLILPKDLKLETFSYVSDTMKVLLLSLLPDQERSYFLSSLSLDDLTDFFDDLSDEDLKEYLKLLHKKDRQKVLSLLQFDPESAGGIMHTDVLTLMTDFTIEQSIKILQRLQPTKEFHQIIYVTNQDNELIGNINLEDLVLKSPKTRLTSILKKNILVVKVNEDQEKIAQDMSRYKISSAPVVSNNNIFLGVIDSDALVDIIEQEAAEDVYRISALKGIKQTYFETPFIRLFYQRASILTVLLLAQVFSELLIKNYESILLYFAKGFLAKFITMIGSTGGNTSSQTSALAIQGLVSGEITFNNMFRFLKREFLMACTIGLTLGIISFIRILITNPIFSAKYLALNFVVSLTLGMIVLVSVTLGSVIPFMLKKLNIDPAFSAGPFLATLMDVLGIFIYCSISKLILNI